MGPSALAQTELQDQDSVVAVMNAAADCGLPAGSVTAEYVDDFQSTVFTVTVGTDGKYRAAATCLAYWNVSTGHIIDYDDQIVRGRQHVKNVEHGKRLGDMSARSWLSGAGLSEKWRPFDPAKQNINQYLRGIERLCKSKPGTLLTTSVVPGMVTFVPDTLIKRSIEADTWSFGCAFSIMALAELEKHGLSFGFIGNEAFNPVPQQ